MSKLLDFVRSKGLLLRATALAMALVGAGAGRGEARGIAAAPAMASVLGPNTDFPDANLVLPFDAASPRSTYLSTSNVGSGPIDAVWYFYDESGVLVTQVTRAILGEGGTDIIDLTKVADRTIEDDALVEGTSQTLAGLRGFAVVEGNGEQRLIGSYTIANTDSSSAFGGSAAGFGLIGALAPGAALIGTTFKPTSLTDNELIVIGLNLASEGSVTSLTNGEQPADGAQILNLDVVLHDNGTTGVLASGKFAILGSAMVVSLEDLFPSVSLSSSATIDVLGSEGSGYTGSAFDPDGDTSVAIIGFYGQTLGQFGTGQNLRTLP